MVDLDELERSILEEYRSATAPPTPVADVMLEGLAAAAPASAAATASASIGGALAKTIAGIAIGGVVAGAVYLAVAPGQDREVPVSRSVESVATPAPVGGHPTERAEAPSPSVEAAQPTPPAEEAPGDAFVPPFDSDVQASQGATRKRERPAADAKVPDAAPTPTPTVQRPSDRDSLARETQLVKQADGEIRAGHLDAASRTIRSYRREFANGVLTNEMQALEHILACKNMDPRAAESARRFVESHAGGLAKRVSDACF